MSDRMTCICGFSVVGDWMSEGKTVADMVLEKFNEHECPRREMIDKLLAKANGARWFGVPLDELSPELMFACAIQGWEYTRDISEGKVFPGVGI